MSEHKPIRTESPDAIRAVLVKAARIVAQADDYIVFACMAINNAADSYFSPSAIEASKAFAWSMGKRYNPCGGAWWPRDKEHRNVRVLALLFTAEMIRTGDA